MMCDSAASSRTTGSCANVWRMTVEYLDLVDFDGELEERAEAEGNSVPRGGTKTRPPATWEKASPDH